MCVCESVSTQAGLDTHFCVHVCVGGSVGVRTGACSCLYVPYFLKYKSGRLFLSRSFEVVVYLRQAFI